MLKKKIKINLQNFYISESERYSEIDFVNLTGTYLKLILYIVLTQKNFIKANEIMVQELESLKMILKIFLIKKILESQLKK